MAGVGALSFLEDRKGRISASFLSRWRRCRTSWAMHYLAPHPEATPERRYKGILSRKTSDPLLVGSAFHKFVEAWYHTRCTTGEDTGEPNLELALAEADKVFHERKEEFEDVMGWEEGQALVRRLGLRYHEWFGPGGLDPEFPKVRVLFDTQGPMIEREHEYELATGYLYYCRTDLFVEDTDAGLCYARDFKTTSASGLWRRAADLDMDAQLTGELWTLTRAVESQGVAGVEGLLVNKNPAQRPKPDSPPEFHIHKTYRTPEDLEKWRSDTVATMQEIEEHVAAWESLLAEGEDPWRALRKVFSMDGTSTGACLNTYWRACEYLAMDQNIGGEERQVAAYRPRPPRPPRPLENEETVE